MKQTDFDPSELERFREVQRLAYACAVDVASDLRAGVTEREATARMESWMANAGVRTFFHRPFAWFGDRSAFRGFRTELAFLPTGRRLELGMPFILDVAPIVDGYVADIGFASSLGEHRVQERMREDLLAVRTLIRDGVRARKNFAAIYEELDRWIARHGYENAHRKYPQRVLAHRVVRLDRVSKRHLFRFGLDQARWLLPQTFLARLQPSRFESPVWNDGPESDHAPLPGLWAVEPHLAFGGVGAKWEEILVVTHDDAYWLDDDVPHVREGRARGWIAEPAAPNAIEANTIEARA